MISSNDTLFGMNAEPPLPADEQIAVLADLYSQRAEAYDELWSPIIRPVGERLLDFLELSNAQRVIDVGTGAGALLRAIQLAVSEGQVLGVDRSEGMLRLGRQKFAGPLALMDVQRLGIQSDKFDAAVLAFVLFHLPSPRRCLEEVNRVLKPGGRVGAVTWGPENVPRANVIWDEELTAAGAPALNLPAVDNRGCCNTVAKMTALLQEAGYVSIKAWSEPLEHRWQPKVHFEYQLRSPAQQRLKSLEASAREACLRRVRDRLSGVGDEDYIFSSEVVLTTAVKPFGGGGR
jgi:ubiquinone/menaquinone biosynthesis C-methylase UbiE